MEWTMYIEQDNFSDKADKRLSIKYNIIFINPSSIQQCYNKENLNHVDKIRIYQLNPDWPAN